MDILYKQPEEDRESSLSHFGVQTCYFKKLLINYDHKSITKKTHYHTGFEIHLIIDGYQVYEAGGKTYILESGSFLFVCPNIPHTVITSAPHTKKYSLTFNAPINETVSCFAGKMTDRMCDNMNFITDEAVLKKEISSVLIENCILEILVAIFRLSGMKEKTKAYNYKDNIVLKLAKQYIEDNIEFAPDVYDVSQYCYLSTKQLTRIFNKFEGVSPGEYIIKQRIQRIEKLLADDTLSLKQISDRMHFGSEYYFNAFFKKHSGMPPGECRKMLGK